jgi:hypothetical protein
LLYSVYRAQVARILEDPSETAWASSAYARHLTEAVRRVADKTGTASTRISMNLVLGQQEYSLASTVRKVIGVRILPVDGLEAGAPLPQVDMSQLPVDATTQAEPNRYAMRSYTGTNLDQLSLFLWPEPDRNGTDSIIIDTRTDFVFTADDPTPTTPQDAQKIPFPPMFEMPIIYFACAFLLQERSSREDLEKSRMFEAWANEKLSQVLPVESLQYHVDYDRRFP